MFAYLPLNDRFVRRFYVARPGVAVGHRDQPNDAAALSSFVRSCEEWLGRATLRSLPVLTKRTASVQVPLIAEQLKREAALLKAATSDKLSKRADAAVDELVSRWSYLVYETVTATKDVPANSSAIGTAGLFEPLNPKVDAHYVWRVQDVCKRFGFRTLRIAGEVDMSPASRDEALDRIEVSLGRACGVLGLPDEAFGGGQMDFCLDRQLPSLAGTTARYVLEHGPTATMHWADHSPNCLSGLVHLFAHRVDQTLGMKATQAHFDRHGFAGPVHHPEGLFFSELPIDRRELLPGAEAALKRLVGAVLPDSTDVDDPMRMSKVLFPTLSRAFTASVMGLDRYQRAPNALVQRWDKAVRQNDDAFLKSLIRDYGKGTWQDAAASFFADFRKRTGSTHPVAENIKALHPARAVIPTPGVFRAMELLWPTIQALTRSNVLAHTEEIQAGGAPSLLGYCRPTTHFATAVSDPQRLRDIAMGFGEKSESAELNARALGKASRAWGDLLQSSGIAATRATAELGQSSSRGRPNPPGAHLTELLRTLSAVDTRRTPSSNVGRPG